MMYNILKHQIAIPLSDYIKHKARATRSQHRLKFTRLRTSSDSQIQLLSSHHKRLGWASSRHHRAAHLGAVQGGHQMRVGIKSHVFTCTHLYFCTYLDTHWAHKPSIVGIIRKYVMLIFLSWKECRWSLAVENELRLLANVFSISGYAFERYTQLHTNWKRGY